MTANQHDSLVDSGQLNPFYRPSSALKISSIESSSEGLNIVFESYEKPFFFSWFWIKDHGIDAQSLDQVTLQRQINTFELPDVPECESASLNTDDQLIHLRWADQSRSVISNYVLASVLNLTPSRHHLAPATERVFWDKFHPLTKNPISQFDDIMGSDEGLRAWLQNIHIYGFALVENVPSTVEATQQLALRLGRVQETLFDSFWELSSELTDHGDTAYTNDYLEPHTDSTYYHDAPGLQMFNCFEFDCKGGESIQVDGFAIAKRLQAEHPEEFKTLCEISVPGHYIEPGAHMRAERPVIKLNSQGEITQVSFNNYDRAPMLLSKGDHKRFFKAYGLFHDYANDQENWHKITLQPGVTLIFDNWRNMHGRMGYVGKRVFYGCYHSKAEYESKLRVLQATDC